MKVGKGRRFFHGGSGSLTMIGWRRTEEESKAWRHVLVIPTLKRQRQKDCHMFKAQLDYTVEFTSYLNYIAKFCL